MIEAHGTARVAVEKIARAGEPRGEFRTFAGIAAPEAAGAVAEAIVPFGEARRMVAELVAARARCPTARR